MSSLKLDVTPHAAEQAEGQAGWGAGGPAAPGLPMPSLSDLKWGKMA